MSPLFQVSTHKRNARHFTSFEVKDGLASPFFLLVKWVCRKFKFWLDWFIVVIVSTALLIIAGLISSWNEFPSHIQREFDFVVTILFVVIQLSSRCLYVSKVGLFVLRLALIVTPV
ncbi:hypothetical protein B0H13DRAFT_2366720 [Mycena leptocephala]|nr:hypothetical protein B0H13DRAFT_2366720 [Mycena leptocephala]